ncbi:GSK-3-binding protein-like [Bombina bombina]|uniref:GSK-3-binding protein-like n=1 Tax=Bombina bombina TaxID=8345 RepID=UPI00235A9F14|nr:GSK-3-binding protein-like [Bombina bombina]
MPCRKESFLLLEQSVTVGSQEVDTLVARIGEALQLNAQRSPTSCSRAYATLKTPLPVITRAATSCSCVRGRSTPYPVCTPRGAGRYHHQNLCTGPRGNKQLCGRGWVRSSCRKHSSQQDDEDGVEDDPHQLLQELLLSGNLIKEAVRRLHLTGSVESPSTQGSAVQCKVVDSTETTTVQ